MPDIECPECGHKALSVATRCPRCGHAFPARPLHRLDPGRRRDWPSALLAGVVVIGAVLLVATLRRPSARPGSAVAPAGPAAEPAKPSERTARPPSSPAPGTQATPPAASEGRLTRYARTWVNVRDGRARGTASVRVLNPGEQVWVDSLEGGWYRVFAEGRALGYVHRSNLAAGPPTAGP